jgi:hypothetical protein
VVDDVYQFVIAARDNASQTIARTSRELRGLGGASTAVASPMARLSSATGGLVSPLTLALGATAALTAGLASAVENARADEQSQRLLAAALEANIPAYDGNIEAVEKVIDSRLKLGFTDEAQRESLRQLVAQTKDQTAALELQRTAMDLARLRNIDLTTASTLLGKVYGGNIGILARYGIQLEKGTTATEAIAEIQRRAAGQAEAWTEGLEGQSAALGIAFDELSEDIGYALVGPLTEAVKFLNEEAVPALQGLVTWLGEAGDAMSYLTTNTNELGGTDFAQIAKDWRAAFLELLPGEPEIEVGFDETRDGITKVLGRMPHEVVTRDVVDGWSGMLAEPAAAAADAAATEFGLIPKKSADQMLESQFHFNAAVDELREYMDEYLTPKQEKIRLRAFLASKAVADGLASGKPGVVRKTQELVDAAQERLNSLNGRSAGQALADTWIGGVADGIRAGVGVINDALYYAKVNSIGGSLPRSGPLTGSELDKAARSVAERYNRSLSGNLSFSAPGIGGGQFGAGGGGGVNIVFNSTFPPTRSQATEIARTLLPELERERRRQLRH